VNTKKPPLESTVVKNILIYLRARGGFWVKIHGSPFQVAGIPDILGCYQGRFCAFEVKRDITGRPSPLQRYTMKKIRAAGGVAALIHSVDGAQRVLDRVESSRRPRASDQD
jgi:hypothetical protein